MKIEYILRILFDLTSKRIVSSNYLCQKYGISKRSVYRYIDCLDAAGVPIYTVRGKGGGFAVVDTYRISSTFMTRNEFEATINALSGIVGVVPDQALSAAIDKLRALRKNEYSGFEIKSGGLIIDAGPWGDASGYKSKLAVITKSIEDCKSLFIRYHDRNGEITERTIDPHVIVFKQGLFYVYAYCHLRNDFRFFKTGRIENATVTSKTFTKQSFKESDLPLDFWHNSVKAEFVLMEIDKSVLSDVEEWLGIENVERVGDKFVARAALPYDNGLVSKIMSFGKGIRVISPANLKEQIRANAEAIIENYLNPEYL